jgi:biotin carboxylase
MAIFNKKIIEAYFLNKEHTTVEIIYTEDGKNYSHVIEVDNNHPDFQDLINEYPLERIEKTTIIKHKQARIETKELARQFSGEYVEELKREIIEIKNQYGWKNLLKYIDDDDQDELFKLKLEIFEIDIIKSSNDLDTLNEIRNARTFMKVLQEFKKLCST